MRILNPYAIFKKIPRKTIQNNRTVGTKEDEGIQEMIHEDH